MKIPFLPETCRQAQDKAFQFDRVCPLVKAQFVVQLQLAIEKTKRVVI
jgi:hypothetical protein